MAVMQNKLVFGTVDSSTYGIYISGEGVFNAPKRDVEMVTIPGRNGALLLDRGSFENITVTYPAFTYETSMATFSQNLANFRNALCAQKGYQRLTDTFHTDEYRMAAFVDGIEINPLKYNTASEFNIVFECKPQRFLTSGETKSTATNGGTISNPTLFASNPLLEVKGYGTVTMNNYPITLDNVVLGNVLLIPAGGANPAFTKSYGTGLVNTGDDIGVASGTKITIVLRAASTVEIQDAQITNTGGVYSVNDYCDATSATFWITFPAESFTAGTNKTVSSNFTAAITHRWGAGIEQSQTLTFTPQIKYTASTRTFEVSCAISPSPTFTSSITKLCECKAITANSSVSALGNPTYIDCEIGEAYKIVNSDVVSLNNAVTIGTALPELSPGSNSITFPNTITEVKYTPRWWKI